MCINACAYMCGLTYILYLENHRLRSMASGLGISFVEEKRKLKKGLNWQ